MQIRISDFVRITQTMSIFHAIIEEVAEITRLQTELASEDDLCALDNGWKVAWNCGYLGRAWIDL